MAKLLDSGSEGDLVGEGEDALLAELFVAPIVRGRLATAAARDEVAGALVRPLGLAPRASLSLERHTQNLCMEMR